GSKRERRGGAAARSLQAERRIGKRAAGPNLVHVSPVDVVKHAAKLPSTRVALRTTVELREARPAFGEEQVGDEPSRKCIAISRMGAEVSKQVDPVAMPDSTGGGLAAERYREPFRNETVGHSPEYIGVGVDQLMAVQPEARPNRAPRV